MTLIDVSNLYKTGNFPASHVIVNSGGKKDTSDIYQPTWP